MKWYALLAACSFLSMTVWAQDCGDIASELDAMKKAQMAIQMSLISNHALMAESMDSYAQALSETAGRVHRTVSSNMLETSKSFKERGDKAHKTVLKLDVATADLISRINRCLK